MLEYILYIKRNSTLASFFSSKCSYRFYMYMPYLYNLYLEGDISAGILDQSTMGARNRVGIELSFRAVQVNLLRSPGIDSQPGLLKVFQTRA
jgi:hypothetical protein